MANYYVYMNSAAFEQPETFVFPFHEGAKELAMLLHLKSCHSGDGKVILGNGPSAFQGEMADENLVWHNYAYPILSPQKAIEKMLVLSGMAETDEHVQHLTQWFLTINWEG